jgi:hypothetical protein
MFSAINERAGQCIRRSARALYDSGLCLVGEWVKRIPELTI